MRGSAISWRAVATAGLAALVDGTTPSGLVAELPAAFQGLAVAVARFIPGDPCRTVSPVFALNFGAASPETLHALNGLVQAAGQIPPDPVAPVFFGLANRTPTTRTGSSQDAYQVFAGLGDGTDNALWAV